MGVASMAVYECRPAAPSHSRLHPRRPPALARARRPLPSNPTGAPMPSSPTGALEAVFVELDSPNVEIVSPNVELDSPDVEIVPPNVELDSPDVESVGALFRDARLACSRSRSWGHLGLGSGFRARTLSGRAPGWGLTVCSLCGSCSIDALGLRLGCRPFAACAVALQSTR